MFRIFRALWNKVKNADLRAVGRWLYLNRKTAVSVWLTVGLVLTWAVISGIWYVGGSPATPAGIQNGPFGPVRMPAQSAIPGLGYVLLSHWWGWLALCLFILLFSVTSPALLLALPLAVIALALTITFGPVGLAVTLIFLPFRLVMSSPSKVINTMLEAVDSADRSRGLWGRFLSVFGPSRYSAEGYRRLMDQYAVAEFLKQTPTGDPILLGTAYGHNVEIGSDKNVLMMAPPGAAKGQAFILHNLMHYQGGVFVLDVKGENAAYTANTRAAYGPVYVLDPHGVTDLPRARFNPLALLNGPHQVLTAQMMANALIESSDGDDHWTGSAKELLTALMLFVATSSHFPRHDLPTVREALMAHLPETLQAMAADTSGCKTISHTGRWGLNTAEKEWSSIVSTLVEQTRWLEDPSICECLGDGGRQVDFAAFRTQVQSVYVCLSVAYFPVFAKWLRLLTSCGLDALTLGQPVKPPHQIRFILDEISQLGNLAKIESSLTLLRGYGVQLWGIWHHIRDISRCYPQTGVDGWFQTCGLRLSSNLMDNATVDYFANSTSGVLSASEVRSLPSDSWLVQLDEGRLLMVEKYQPAYKQFGATAGGASLPSMIGEECLTGRQSDAKAA